MQSSDVGRRVYAERSGGGAGYQAEEEQSSASAVGKLWIVGFSISVSRPIAILLLRRMLISAVLADECEEGVEAAIRAWRLLIPEGVRCNGCGARAER